jgi:hypothetical protein
MALAIKQGDQYILPVGLEKDGVEIDGSTIYSIEAVEFYLGDNLMEYKKDGTGNVQFEGSDFLLPLTQKLTFALRSMPVPLYIRVKTIDGDVIGLDKIMVQVDETRSRREL